MIQTKTTDLLFPTHASSLLLAAIDFWFGMRRRERIQLMDGDGWSAGGLLLDGDLMCSDLSVSPSLDGRGKDNMAAGLRFTAVL